MGMFGILFWIGAGEWGQWGGWWWVGMREHGWRGLGMGALVYNAGFYE